MPGKKTMEQAKKLGMKSKGYKAGKTITIPSKNKKKLKIPKPFEIGKVKAGKKVKMNIGMKVPTFNEVARMKTGGKV
jgi:hypothetical protein